MTITIEATVENGQLKLKQPLPLPEGVAVQVQVTPLPGQIAPPPLPDEDPLADVIGICDGPGDGAENHDKYIYGKLRP